MAQEVVEVQVSEGLRTPVGDWRDAGLDLVEVAEHETAASGLYNSEREMAACGMRHVSLGPV